MDWPLLSNVGGCFPAMSAEDISTFTNEDGSNRALFRNRPQPSSFAPQTSTACNNYSLPFSMHSNGMSNMGGASGASYLLPDCSTSQQNTFGNTEHGPKQWPICAPPETGPNAGAVNMFRPLPTSHPHQPPQFAATEYMGQEEFSTTSPMEAAASFSTQHSSMPYFSWSQPDCPQLDFAQMNMHPAEFTHSPPEALLDANENGNYQTTEPTVWNMLGWKRRAPTVSYHALPHLNTGHLCPPDRDHANQSPSSASTAGSTSSLSRIRSAPGDLQCYSCNSAFVNQGDLSHHMRSHQPYSSRKFGCTKCERRFMYRKDLARHLPRHDPHRRRYYCPFQSCKYHRKGFGRQDHLDRHIDSQHKTETST